MSEPHLAMNKTIKQKDQNRSNKTKGPKQEQ
jgi:hypothetical protein